MIFISQWKINGRRIVCKMAKENGEYGIAVTEATRYYSVCEKIKIKSVSPHVGTMQLILSKISKYKVSMCNFCDVIEDLIC